MRVGQNPIKTVESIEPPAKVTVVVVSYIPYLSGYYLHSLEVLRLCLSSLHANTPDDFDLMVFDNGSCAEVREFLLAEQASKRIQYLTLSERNLGKPAAWNSALLAAPGEFVAYADSDVYFHPGWLQASIAALDAFPQAGMVTAMPMLIPEKYSTYTIEWAERQTDLNLQRGALLPWDDFWRHARSLGDSEDKAREFYEANAAIRVTRDSQTYFVGAAHFQFTARKSALKQVLPISADRPMGKVRLLDEAMNAAGYLRFCTAGWYVQHLGNTVPVAEDLVIKSTDLLPKKTSKRTSALWSWRPIRKVLQWLYGWSFDRLHRGE